MTLPSSGPLSLSAIQGEFGGSNPISLSEYYGVASGIPTSGSIDISDFYGSEISIDTFTVTNGFNLSDDGEDSPSDIYELGYIPNRPDSGSLSNYAVNFLGNATIAYLYTERYPKDSEYDFYLQVNGTHSISSLASMSITNPLNGITYTFPVPGSSGTVVTILANGSSAFSATFYLQYISGRTMWRWFTSNSTDVLGVNGSDDGRVSSVTLKSF